MNTASLPMLDVLADLRIESHNSLLTVTGDGETVVIESEDLRLAVALANSFFSRVRLMQMGRVLATIGVTLEIRSKGRLHARLGRRARSWWLRLLGHPHIELRSPRLLLSARQLK